MMKVCSFLPAATQMIRHLGLEEHLCGVTFECDSDKPRVVRSCLEGRELSSAEIDSIVSEFSQLGKPLYYIDETLLEELAPDVIFTQDVCDVCQIDTSIVQRAVYKLKKKPVIVPLIPRTLADVFENIIRIAQTLGKEENAYTLLATLQQRTDQILDTLRANRAPLKRVMIMEWLDPVYNCGHWIPYQVSMAGGVDMLSNPGGYSIVTPWDKICLYNPEVLVVAPCGFKPGRAAREMDLLTRQEGWNELLAVKEQRVFLADAHLFTQPGTGLIDGIELLAALFHPDLFSVPEQLKRRFMTLESIHA
ncbi:MAG TPA: ABC transporter substrate-binding protein [Bacteroidia bacterium]|jgi:iron complex transport system substrate-binding protein|nr:ABC transporter substrate-binding protein [Bacteroidia bacterium]